MKNPTRDQACILLMQRALVEPVAIALDSPALAKAWRSSCYKVRRPFMLTDPAHPYSTLKFVVDKETLTVERMDEGIA